MKAETLLPLGKLDPGLRAPDAAFDLAAVGPQAKVIDEMGYYSLLMEETKDDPFQVLALAAAATQRVRIGTSVAIAFARSPFVLAQSAWTAQKISQGRFELGIGSQVRGHIRRRFGMPWHPPGPWMRDYVGALKAIWHSWQHGTPLDYNSAHYQLNLNVPLFTPAPLQHPHIPVQVAAVNEYMAGVAAEVADGVRLHPVCSPQYIAQTLLPAIQRGLARREADTPFDICLKPLIATAADEQGLRKRIAITRQRLAFYCSTPAYVAAFAGAGLSDFCAEMAKLSKAGKWDTMATLVDDKLLHEYVVVATYDKLADTLQSRYGELVQRIEVSIPVETQADQLQLRRIVQELSDM
ncbi:MAG: TIGR03617 family F420-dependent LLM class oxidoreductase [Pseudomonadota bacterium]